MSEIVVVFYADACDEHRVEHFGDPNVVSVRKTWQCEKCKATVWKTVEAKIWARVGE